MRSFTASAVAAALLSVAPVDAFWRLPCKAPLLVERADPIVNPGKPSGHLHTIMGGNGFGFDMDYADTQASTCSSCTVTKDFSNYWVPSLFYQGADGKFQSVKQIGGGLIYYLQRSDPKDPEFANGLLAFPEGFRMLAGNPMLRSFSPTLEQRAINFNCLGAAGKPETNEIPDYNCPGGLRAQVFFPSCWDGVNLDSADHKSHMAYPDRVDSGVCPPSHPKRFISLFYEVSWDINEFKDQWHGAGHPFVFANGDKTGYGYHGDFVNGWDVPTLQRAVTECTNLSGVVEDCPVFEFFKDEVANSCKIAPSIDEQVSGTLDALPGCNPASGEGANAVSSTGCGAPTTISAPENPFIDLTVSKKFQYIGCGTDKLGSRTLTGASQDLPDMTIEKCVDFCTSKGFSIAGTEYSTQCYCGNSVPADRAPIAGLMGDCYMKCGGDTTENCGGAGTISLYEKCGASCQNLNFNINNSTLTGGAAAAPAVKVPVALPAASSAPVVVEAPVESPAASVSPIATVGAAAPVNSAPAAPAVVAAPAQSEGDNDSSEPEVVTASIAVSPIPAAAAATPVAGSQGQCGGQVTVTIAATTVTVTVGAEAPTKAAVKAAESAPVVAAAPVASSAAPVVIEAPAASSVAPVESIPTLLPSSTGAYSNGTHGTHGGKGHGHKHTHRPSGGFASRTGRPVPLSTGN